MANTLPVLSLFRVVVSAVKFMFETQTNVKIRNGYKINCIQQSGCEIKQKISNHIWASLMRVKSIFADIFHGRRNFFFCLSMSSLHRVQFTYEIALVALYDTTKYVMGPPFWMLVQTFDGIIISYYKLQNFNLRKSLDGVRVAFHKILPIFFASTILILFQKNSIDCHCFLTVKFHFWNI